jgi:hypothetical protein
MTTPSGRFRTLNLMTMTEAARVEENGDRYLIDETTAIVRFIFPCGQPQKLPLGLAQDFDVPEPNTDEPRVALRPIAAAAAIPSATRPVPGSRTRPSSFDS